VNRSTPWLALVAVIAAGCGGSSHDYAGLTPEAAKENVSVDPPTRAARNDASP